MPATTPALPAGASLARSFEKGLDITSGASWLTMRRISNLLTPTVPITQPADSYDTFGSPLADKTSESWTVTHNILVNRLPTGYYLPEVEAIKAATEPDSIGDLAVVTIRWYDKPYSGTPHPEDAYEGDATVGFTRVNVAPDGATETWAVTYTGRGKRRKIANPWTGWDPAIPAIASVTPEGEGAGELVLIEGQNFTGASSVTFEAVEATDFEVIGAGTISAVLPAGTAGEVDVIVTTPAGASAVYPYTRA